MKKNITINLFGQLYNIDEDAYELLLKYEQNMRSYFSSKEGGAEIADDIEHRVAELLAELRAQGTEAINIEHVEAIIRRIGNPEDMDDDAEESYTHKETTKHPHQESDGEKNWLQRRRLYRDREDAMIAGVLSGLCRFFGGSDPLPWRIIFVLLAIFSASTLCIIYLILWAIVPEASCAEDRLRMQGKAVNTENLNEEILRETNRTNKPEQTEKASNSGGKGCLIGLLQLFILMCKVVLFAIAGFMFFMVAMLLLPLLLMTFGGMQAMLSWGWIDDQFTQIYFSVPHITWQLWILAFALVIAVGLPFIVLLRRLLNPKRKSSSTGKRMLLIVIWVISLVVSLATTCMIAIQLDKAEEKYIDKLYERNGIFIRQGWATIDERGWGMKTYKGCSEWLTFEGVNIFSGNPGRQYFHFSPNYRHDGAMRSRMECSKHFTKGRYKLCAVATSSGNGCLIYAQLPGDSTHITKQVPLTNDSNAMLINMPWEQVEKLPYLTENMSIRSAEGWQQVQDNIEKPNWAYVETDDFEHPGGTIKYGITNDYKFTGIPWDGNWYSVYDVQIIKMSDSSN